ncbi:SPFH domain-containing protein [Agathobaculum sp.]|uniref:SPFH domain-containing protein n=1 Tax=Agathobaculum sp. TaxID=2048138 RepID=UPI002A801C07|nr:SPFH domain-containing protein [Agathobaculum sp.]MDY3619386.1 SPFH domain-containing protein [Agathobaculum sp.]
MEKNEVLYQERLLKAPNGLAVLMLNILLMIAAVAGIVWGAFLVDGGQTVGLGVALLVVCIFYWCLPCWLLFAGVKVLKPNEALVLTLFGKYVGTLKGEGIFFVNPFCSAVNPAAEVANAVASDAVAREEKGAASKAMKVAAMGKKLSLKTMTLNNDKQKINDLLGNPIIIGIAVIWRIEDTAKAVFAVDNYREFLSIQSDAALRNTVRLYPYDVSESGDEKSLRGSSQEIAAVLAEEIQQRVSCAGLKIEEARITTLAYAPEIAAAMLQRQQASAVIDARKMIVEGAVGMVEMALGQLSEKEVCELDDERRAQMVSNLMVVLCANKEAQPIVNSGSIY